MIEPPEMFSIDAYEMCIDLIKKYPPYNNLTVDNALKLLSQYAGGSYLSSAIDKYSFPPCPTNPDCSACWVVKWCIHKKTSSSVRDELKELEAFITLPEIKIDKDILEIIIKADKTDSCDIDGLLTTLKLLQDGQLREASEDVHTEKSRTNKNNEV